MSFFLSSSLSFFLSLSSSPPPLSLHPPLYVSLSFSIYLYLNGKNCEYGTICTSHVQRTCRASLFILSNNNIWNEFYMCVKNMKSETDRQTERQRIFALWLLFRSECKKLIVVRNGTVLLLSVCCNYTVVMREMTSLIFPLILSRVIHFACVHVQSGA